MKKCLRVLAAASALFSLLAVGAYSKKPPAQAPPQDPILDKAANKVIQKYEQSSCEDLWKKKSANTPPSAEEKRLLQFLKGDTQMRMIFIDKVASPIANKMFECGMIP